MNIKDLDISNLSLKALMTEYDITEQEIEYAGTKGSAELLGWRINFFKRWEDLSKTVAVWFFDITAGLGGKTLLEDWQLTQFRTDPADPDYRTEHFRLHPAYSLQTAFMRRYARRWATGIGADLFYGSYYKRIRQLENASGHADEAERVSPWSVGVALKHNAYYHRLSLNMSVGVYLFRQMGSSAKVIEKPYYEQIGVHYSFPKWGGLTIGASIQAHRTKADLTEIIEGYNFYEQSDVDNVVELKLTGTDEDRPKIDAILDAVSNRFQEELQEEDQIKCKSAIKNFCRCYPYFSAILPYESPEWEKQYIFYSLLLKKLPRLKIDDNTDGLLDDIDFDKYRIVKEEERTIELENIDSAVSPIPVSQGGGIPSPDMDVLSNIVKDFNDTYGNIEWKNSDEVQRQIEELPARIADSIDFVNAVRNGDKQVAQITFNDTIVNIVAAMLEEKTEFVQTYFANQDFQNFVNARVFQAAVSQLSSARV